MQIIIESLKPDEDVGLTACLANEIAFIPFETAATIVGPDDRQATVTCKLEGKLARFGVHAEDDQGEIGVSDHSPAVIASLLLDHWDLVSLFD